MEIPIGYAAVAIELQHTLDPEPCMITFGIETDLATFSPVEHANQVKLAWTLGPGGGLTSEVATTRAILRFGQDGTPPLVVESDTPPVNGSSTSDTVPQNVAVLVKKNTGLGGRQNRGRFFVPWWIGEGNVNEVGVITGSLAAYQASVDGFMNDLTNGATGSSPLVPTPMVILHSPSNLGFLPPPTPVTSLTVDSVVATQRRRLRR